MYLDNMFICLNDFKRAYAGLSFIKSGQANYFIVGDDTSGGFHESQAIKYFLLNNQLEPEQIITGEFKNTKDEALKVEQLVANGKIKDFILVTSAKHMRRVVAIFASRGFDSCIVFD